METPRNTRKMCPIRTPTPRLSQRKRNLFENTPVVDDENLLQGIKVLETSDEDLEMQTSSKSVKDFHKIKDSTKEAKKPTRRSPRSLKNALENGENCKENAPKNILNDGMADEEFREMFDTSLRLDGLKLKEDVKYQQSKSTNANKPSEKETVPRKRGIGSHEMMNFSTQVKLPRTCTDFETISTKNFYSSAPEKYSPATSVSERGARKNTSPPNFFFSSNNSDTSPKSRNRHHRYGGINKINRGVKHKIRRSGNNHSTPLSSVDVDLILKNVHNEKLKKIIYSKREERKQIEKVHNILRTCKNPISLAKPLSSICGLTNFHNNNNENDVAYTDPLSPEYEYDEVSFSETEYYIEDENIEDNTLVPNAIVTQPLINTESTESTSLSKRKFFKTSRVSQTPKEITITENIKASLCNGKLSLLHDVKKKMKPKRRISVSSDFSDEQATVDAILENLDNSNILDTTNSSKANPYDFQITNTSNKEKRVPIQIIEDIQLWTNSNFDDFRKKIPYKTNDPAKIEQQQVLLEFLINNNMCTEENFTIFIADPDNHKEKAAQIVDQVFVVVNEEENINRLGLGVNEVNTSAQDQFAALGQKVDHSKGRNDQTSSEIESILNPIQRNLDFIECDEGITLDEDTNTLNNAESIISCDSQTDVLENPSNVDNLQEDSFNLKSSPESDNLFAIFDKSQWTPLQQQFKRNLPRTWNGGEGTNQYQIDAGQKQFGAQQCKQCGLVYSIHEPEEEKLHQEFHLSLQVLRFKGWIDEDIVAIYPEWGADGRILRIKESSNIRKHERLLDVLSVVDKELGFSSYTLPKIFVAYLAIRKFQIVGLCLVEPLKKAHKYMNVNGVDCYSQEEFPATCGISRIWVSPLHRRLHIASKLIQAVQQNTVLLEEIPLSQIAFSAPTECGKLFAQKITQSKNFLVYQ